MRPKALILLATGTNRDGDAARAFELAGARPEIVPLKCLRTDGRPWRAYQLLVIAGGFSYADALGAGKLLALDLVHYFADQAQAFVAAGKPVIGICNGFQALVKSGLLPGSPAGGTVSGAAPAGISGVSPAGTSGVYPAGISGATLTFNQGGHFECRWVTLQPVSQACLWTRGLQALIDCPVAHGEGNFAVQEPVFARSLQAANQVALVYTRPDGSPAKGAYPYNPNGSIEDIAGICNPAGNVLGLMPHPEDHVFPYQHPQWARQGDRNTALPLFQNGVRFAEQL